MKWGVTGTPGTGKTTVTEALDRDVIHLGDMIDDDRFSLGYDDDRRTIIADLDALSQWLDAQEVPLIIESHLAHLLPVDRVIVLRCHPDVLRERLSEREEGHSIDENVSAERLDVVLSESVDRHGDTAIDEIDTTSMTPTTVAETIESIIGEDRRFQPGSISFPLES